MYELLLLLWLIYFIVVVAIINKFFFMKMAINIAKVEFEQLFQTGENYYMSWKLNVLMHLESMGLTDTVDPSKTPSLQDKTHMNVFDFNKG